MSIGLVQAVGIGAVVVLVAVVLFLVFLLASAVRIVNEYERGVIFRLGRVQGRAKGPGLFLLIPIVDRMVKVELRTVSMAVTPQEVITRDNVPARVQAIIDEHTEPWGVKVSAVEVRDVQIPQQMQRSMAGQAEAERERRAKVIAAGGGEQASHRLRGGADRLESPTALQLRLFQTLAEISSEQSSTVVLPVPIDLFRPYLDAHSTNGATKPPQATRREEAEAQRRYEEAVGQARSEQKAVQDLEPDGTNPPVPPTPAEDVAASGELPPDATMPGEEQPPGERPLRPGPS